MGSLRLRHLYYNWLNLLVHLSDVSLILPAYDTSDYL